MRFTGTVEVLGSVNVADLVSWVGDISFESWPQQRPLDDGQLRPAMVTDPEWFGFKARTDGVVDRLMDHFPAGAPYQRMLSVVMPGHSIEPHRDWQSPDWVCRVHVPLLSNDLSAFIVAGAAHTLEPGRAYRVNTEAEHSVENAGSTPRVHLMWDVRRVTG